MWKAIFVAAAVTWTAPAPADVVMPPPPLHSDISMQLQRQIIGRFGGPMNRRVHTALSSIVVAGNYGRVDPTFALLMRTQQGWTVWRNGRPRPLPAAAGAELDRLLGGDNFWREDGFVYGQPCPGGRVMQVLHRGRDKVTRQLCRPDGLVGRVADIAASGRVPRGELPPVGGQEEAARAARGSDYERTRPLPADINAAELVMHLKGRSTYALRDGDIEGYLEPYSKNVVVVWPTGTEKGRDKLGRRARAATWNGVDKRHVTPGEGYLRQVAPDRFELTGSYFFSDGNRQLRFPFETRWQRRGAIWEITHEKVGAGELVP